MHILDLHYLHYNFDIALYYSLLYVMGKYFYSSHYWVYIHFGMLYSYHLIYYIICNMNHIINIYDILWSSRNLRGIVLCIARCIGHMLMSMMCIMMGYYKWSSLLGMPSTAMVKIGKY